MHQGRRLQRVVRTFLTKVRGGAAAELLIDDRHEPIGGIGVAGPPCPEQGCDVFARLMCKGEMLARNDEIPTSFSRHAPEHGLTREFRARRAPARSGVMRQTMALALVLVPLQAAAADFRHVRSEQDRVRALLTRGYEQSATLRGLIDELESLPAIVYIDETHAFAGGLAGALLHTVTGTPDAADPACAGQDQPRQRLRDRHHCA